jgi:glycosyltransferase involved in cell wall biosynthesis
MNTPTVSVIIPVRNEGRNIERCLRQIIHQTYDISKLEVLIVDGNSNDDTLELIKKFSEAHPHLNMLVLNDLNCQRTTALNAGIKRANGEYIVRLDARSMISNDYIEQCIATIRQVGADNVGGVQKPVHSPDINITQHAVGLAMSHPFGVGNAQFRTGSISGKVDSVYLGCFPKHIFQKIGYFDDHAVIISEDSDFNYRIRKAGGSVYLNKDIIVHYLPRENMLDLARLYYRYGGARAGFMMKWKSYTGYRQLAPPLFIFALFALPIASIAFSWCVGIWAIMIASYLSLNVLSSISISRTEKKCGLFQRLLIIFPILHFSWAIGFWSRIMQVNAKTYWKY